MTGQDIFELSDSITTELCTLDPLIAVTMGIPGYADQWPDLGPEGTEQKAEFWRSVAKRSQACGVSDPKEVVAKQVLEDECRRGGAGTEASSPPGSLNNIASPWQVTRSSFEHVPHDKKEDWERIITRLLGVREVLNGYRQSLNVGLQTGDPQPRRQVLAAIQQGKEANQHSSLDDLEPKLGESNLADETLEARLSAAVTEAKAAYADMTGWFETDYLPHARPDDAVGRARYLEAVVSHLGSVIDPDDTYEWGWSELHRLRNELTKAAGELEEGASPERALHILRTDPDRAAHSIEEFLEVMEERQHTALALLQGEHFEVPEPVRTIDVKLDPPGGALAAHYSPPSEDFTRPGTVWYPVSGRTFFPLYEEVTTAYHEGFPGHHLQVGWQAAMGDELSRFHKVMVWYPGSGEGWALYAEHLMGELGFLEKPDYRIGLLVSQILRTCRVVIDIGCHLGLKIPTDSQFHPGAPWSYELGREMLESVAYADPEMAESEIVRYLGWPGQAVTYKVGERFILNLRERFDTAGISRRQFHKELLSVGSIGLDLIDELVRPD